MKFCKLFLSVISVLTLSKHVYSATVWVNQLEKKIAKPLIIRKYNPKIDAEQIQKIFITQGKVWVPESANTCIYVGCLDNQIAGIVTYNNELEKSLTGYISLCIVEKSQRGKGYGSQLIRHAHDQLTKKGCFLIEAHAASKSGQKLLEKNYFTPKDRYYGRLYSYNHFGAIAQQTKTLLHTPKITRAEIPPLMACQSIPTKIIGTSLAIASASYTLWENTNS